MSHWILTSIWVGCCLSSAAATPISTEVSVRYGSADTGPSRHEIVSPRLGFSYSLGAQGAHSVGVSYVRFRWSDASSRTTTPPPGSADIPSRVDIDGRSRWRVVFLEYQHSWSLRNGIEIYLAPRFGGARGSGSGEVTLFGGISGILRVPYDESTDLRFAGELEGGMRWSFAPHWRLSAGAAYSYIHLDHPDVPLMGSLNALQVTAALGYRF